MRIKLSILALITTAFVLPLLLLAAPKSVAALDLFGSVCNANDKAKNSSICNDRAAGNASTKNDNAITKIIRTAANLIAGVAGVIAVIMVILSGYMFITAGGASVGQRSGDPNKVKTARSMLVSTLVGAAIIALAWTITRFITDVVI